MKRKVIGMVLATTLTASMLAGCGGADAGTETNGTSTDGADTEEAASGNEESSEEGTEENADAEETASGEKEEVTLWHALTDEEVDLVQSYVDEFNAQSEKSTVKLVYTPTDEMIKQLTIGNIAGDMADMVLMDNCYTSEFAASGVLEDLTSYYDAWEDNQILEGPLSSVTYEDKIYGLPYSCNCLALFYNEDMLTEAGVEVPETWDELKTAAAALTTDEHSGFALCGAKDGEGTFQIYPFINSAGGDINTLGDEGSIEAIQLIGDMIQKGSVSKEIMNWSQADVEKQFASGNCAMMVNGVWQVEPLRSDNPDLNWNVSYIPIPEGGTYATGLGGENLCVTKGANAEACWEFISWICGKEVSPRFCKDMSRFSARADVDNTEWFDDDITLFFANYMEHSFARVHPRWTECASALQVAFQKVYSGEENAADAMAEAQEEIDAINAEE
ncbi:MAG: ABC transporter substrate-binding protein [Clostridia bacterium]|nr:ABC transporter substrate-binding protein [Clostridia bacterium]